MNYEKLFAQIREHEGTRLEIYKCTKGYWTIGVGRNLETNGLSDSECFTIFRKSLSKDQVIEELQTTSLTEEQVEMLLVNDLTNVEENCHRIIDMHKHNDARKAVFINMAFQMGAGGLLKFSNTLKYADAKQYDNCADEMLDSIWFREDTPNRAQEMSDQMRTGEWQ
ncbi:glycoside hydrolase family protein [Paraglaciecola sp.]|uniref:glycoside hydrolase family protein n=1 Tax=Paraglaciecola sp. TaxID=1920173 RepID=UPI003EF6E69A